MKDPSFYNDNDRFSAANGMELVEVGEDVAVARMTIGEQHLNCLGIVHGGVYFSLADLACGASVGYEESGAVTLDSYGEFIASAQVGDTITATAHPEAETRRTVRISVELRNQDDVLLTRFHFTNYKKRR